MRDKPCLDSRCILIGGHAESEIGPDFLAVQFGCSTGEIVSIEVAGAHIEAFSQIGKGLLGNLPRKARKASLDLEEF